MAKFFLIIMLLFGVVSDGVLTGLSVVEILGKYNVFTYILAISAGLIITGLTASTKFIFSQYSTPLTLLWGMAVLADAITTVMGIAKFIQPNNPIGYATAFVSVGLVTGSSLALSFIMEE